MLKCFPPHMIVVEQLAIVHQVHPMGVRQWCKVEKFSKYFLCGEGENCWRYSLPRENVQSHRKSLRHEDTQ